MGESVVKSHFKIIFAAIVASSSIPTAIADPAIRDSFGGISGCIDEYGDFHTAESVRKVVITQDEDNTVNVSIKGICPVTSNSAVNWSDHEILAACDGGPAAGLLDFWKYHMRPDGRYSLKCSSMPLD